MRVLEEDDGFFDTKYLLRMEDAVFAWRDTLSAMMDWVRTLISTISSNPLLLMIIVGSFALVAIGIVRRLFRL